MKIIRERTVVNETWHNLCFDRFGERNSGFSFPCDETGKVDVNALPECARASYAKLLFGELPEFLAPDGQSIDPYVETITMRGSIPAVGQCDCGCEVELDGFTNTCNRCGADYNSAGQRLAPRECWGEETGEHWLDIVNLP